MFFFLNFKPSNWNKPLIKVCYYMYIQYNSSLLWIDLNRKDISKFSMDTHY